MIYVLKKKALELTALMLIYFKIFIIRFVLRGLNNLQKLKHRVFAFYNKVYFSIAIYYNKIITTTKYVIVSLDFITFLIYLTPKWLLVITISVLRWIFTLIKKLKPFTITNWFNEKAAQEDYKILLYD
jgi:hypothetical protein